MQLANKDYTDWYFGKKFNKKQKTDLKTIWFLCLMAYQPLHVI